MIVIPLIAFELNDWFVHSRRKRAVITAPCPLFPPLDRMIEECFSYSFLTLCKRLTLYCSKSQFDKNSFAEV